MRKYDSYRDSGVEWIGEIPSSWISTPLKRMVLIGNGKDYKHIEVEEGGYPVLGTGGVFSRCSEYLHSGPSVLLGRKGTIDKPLFVDEPFWTSDTIYYTVINEEKVHPKLLFHLVHLIPFQLFSYGSAIPSMTKTHYEEMKFPLPPLSEQQQIVSYLDTKTSQIDSLIDKTQRKIELLKEKRTSLINEVVTKGLNPNVEMKDSGVEWIGEIPSHWETIKTNLITTNLDGKRVPLNSEQRSEMSGDIPYWGSGGIVDYINEFIFDEELLLVGEDGSPFFDPFRDVSFYVNEKIWVNNHIHILKTKEEVNTNFLVKSFNCVDYKEYITGSTRDKLTQSDLNRIIHPIPPLSEQHEIVSYLDEHTQLIDKTVSIEERRIELLKEYRQSLISEVVTGKRKVVNDE